MGASKPYDGGSKYLLEYQGGSLATLGGLEGVLSCRPAKSEMTHAMQLPDGLLDVELRGRAEPLPLLVEFCTYPDSRATAQMLDDLAMVWLARKAVADLLVLVLCPKGNAAVPEAHEVASQLGTTGLAGRWRVVRMWELDAEQALASPDLGMALWSILMKRDGPAEPFLRRCRDRIDREGGGQRAELLAVAQTFLGLKREDPKLFDLFGGDKAMIESPVFERLAAERERRGQQKSIQAVVLARFGRLSDDARARLESVGDEAKLDALTRFAVLCPSIDAFVERLVAETTPPPKPASTRRKKKS